MTSSIATLRVSTGQATELLHGALVVNFAETGPLHASLAAQELELRVQAHGHLAHASMLAYQQSGQAELLDEAKRSLDMARQLQARLDELNAINGQERGCA